jgi:hypothetical protein
MRWSVVGEEKEGDSVCRREIIESEKRFFFSMTWIILALLSLIG